MEPITVSPGSLRDLDLRIEVFTHPNALAKHLLNLFTRRPQFRHDVDDTPVLAEDKTSLDLRRMLTPAHGRWRDVARHVGDTRYRSADCTLALARAGRGAVRRRDRAGTRCCRASRGLTAAACPSRRSGHSFPTP